MREGHRPRSFPPDLAENQRGVVCRGGHCADLLAWLRLLCLDRSLAQAETKTLHYRNLHNAVRIVRANADERSNPQTWPWAGRPKPRSAPRSPYPNLNHRAPLPQLGELRAARAGKPRGSVNRASSDARSPRLPLSSRFSSTVAT
jgi:hypothetical protein